MEPPHLDILREAIERRQRKETLERSLGRAVRNREQEFSVYIQIMSEVREFAQKHRLSEADAARQILREGDNES